MSFKWNIPSLIVSSNTPAEFDADARAYFNALAPDVTPTVAQKGYLNTFFISLKGAVTPSSIKRVTFPIWSNASANKWNLFNPVDTDAAYRSTFSGTITHGSGGITSDGTSGYVNTNITPAVLGGTGTFGTYVRTNNATGLYEIGILDAGKYSSIISRYSGDFVFAGNLSTENEIASAYTDSRGFWIITRTTSNSFRVDKNASALATKTEAATAQSTLSFYELSLNNNGTAGYYTGKEIALTIYLSESLDATKSTNVYNAVQALMTSWGLNV